MRITRRAARSLAAAAPTLLVAALAYLGWAGLTLGAPPLGLGVAVPGLALVLALHSSLQHEIIHGRPFANPRANAALVFPALGLLVPLERFRDLHLAHHFDPTLTDPHDDPETNYVTPADWARLSWPAQLVLTANNTLLGRMAIGPGIGLARLVREDWAAARAGDSRVIRAWALHALGVLPVAFWLVVVAKFPLWAYGIACWLALSVLRIRTFLEHRAHERSGARSVIIEDRGPLALLFLYNNFHAVHHAHPNLPWYRLPGEYARRRAEFLRRNDDYRYRSYAEVFMLYFLHRKDPVAHPLRTPGAGAVNPRRTGLAGTPLTR